MLRTPPPQLSTPSAPSSGALVPFSPFGPLSSSAPRALSQGSGRQDPRTVSRIHELGVAGVSVVEIDRTLHREGHKTSTGTRWPAKNDGRVVVRLLINHGVAPVAGDFKIARYVAEYAAKVAEPRAR